MGRQAVYADFDDDGRFRGFNTATGDNPFDDESSAGNTSIFDFCSAKEKADIKTNASVANHSAIFQRAINSGIGDIGLPAYIYNVGDLLIDETKRVSMKGTSGPGGSPTKWPRLRPMPGATHMWHLKDTPFLRLHQVDLWGNNEAGDITGIKIDAAATYAPSCLSLERTNIRAFSNRAIDAGEYRSAVWLDNCLIEDNGGEGIYLFSNQDWRITNCDVGRNGGAKNVDNIVFDGYCSSHDLINTDLYFTPNRGLYIAGGAQIITLALGQVNNCGKEGIYINHNDAYPYADRAINLTGLQFVSNSMSAPGTYANIYTKAPLISVTGCSHLKHPASANVAKWGIQFADVNSLAIVSGGVWKDEYFTTGAFANIGSCVRAPKHTLNIEDRGVRIVETVDGTRTVFEVYKAGQTANPKFSINDQGILRWGDGTNPTDLSLFRLAAAQLYTPHSLRVGSTADYQHTFQLGGIYFWVDTVNKKFMMKPSQPASNTDGTTICTYV